MGLNLVTLGEVKLYNGINSDTQDALIDLLIPQISSYIKKYCNNTFVDYFAVATPKTDIVSGGNPELYLSEAPIVSITSVGVSIDYGTTFTTLTSGVDYILDTELDRVVALPDGGYASSSNGTIIFPKRVNGYKVIYKAGYATLPDDLQLAVLDLVSYYMRADMAIKSPAGIGRNSMAIEYITKSQLPAHISRVLDLYRKQL